MKERYLYFRDQATIANDDARTDSVCFPVEDFVGAHPNSDDDITLFFKSLENRSGSDVGSSAEIVSDSVELKLKTANTHKEFLEAFVNFITNETKSGMLVVGDNLSTRVERFTPLLHASTPVEAVTVAAANS